MWTQNEDTKQGDIQRVAQRVEYVFTSKVIKTRQTVGFVAGSQIERKLARKISNNLFFIHIERASI